jgi:hypothetical protein
MGPIVPDSDLLHHTSSSFVSSSTDVVSSVIPSSAVNSPSIDIFSNSIQPIPGVVSLVPPTIDIFSDSVHTVPLFLLLFPFFLILAGQSLALLQS